MLTNEHVVTGDAKQLELPDASFDAVVSLCALEHFGLGRYGDEFDEQGDIKAISEMRRVLKPGGLLVFTTTLTQAQPSIAHNAHRIYDIQMLRALCQGMNAREEAFFSHALGRHCALDEVTSKPTAYDIYLGAWAKA